MLKKDYLIWIVNPYTQDNRITNPIGRRRESDWTESDWTEIRWDGIRLDGDYKSDGTDHIKMKKIFN